MPKRKTSTAHSSWFKRTDPTLQLTVAGFIFTISVVVTSYSGIALWEIDLFSAVYGMPQFLQPFFFLVTQTGSIWMLGMLLVLYLTKKRYHIVLRMLMTGLLSYLASGFAKDIWGRARPNEFLENILNLDYVVRGPGFPSGHTALATALAFTVAYYLPRKYQWLAFVWVFAVGLSRMYLGIHFPMDIIGGFAIGWGSFALFRHVRLYDTTAGSKKAKKKTT